MPAARRTRSLWPLVIGSNVPGVDRAAWHAADDTRPRRPSRSRCTDQPPGSGGRPPCLRHFHIAEPASASAGRWSRQPRAGSPAARSASKGGSTNTRSKGWRARSGRPASKASASARSTRAPAGLQRRRSCAQIDRRRCRDLLDEHGLARAARQRLEAQRAAAGEEIEHPHARRYAGASQLNSVSRTRSGVGRRPGSSGKVRFAPAQTAADDAQLPERRDLMPQAYYNARPSHAPQQTRWRDDRPGFFGRLREKFSRSARSLSDGLTSLFRGRKIDAELLDELEARLIGADVGIEATQADPRRTCAPAWRAANWPMRDALHAALRASADQHPRALPATAGDRPRRPALRDHGRRRERLGQDDLDRQAGHAPHRAKAAR